LALVLAGCNTYGTGTTPAMQTVQDIAGIAALGGEKKEPIDYESRPKLVPPPNTAALPQPGSEPTTVASADWPKDPDVQYQALKAEVARREKAGEPLPQIKLPRQQRTSQEPIVASIDRSTEAMPKPGESDRARKLFADARGAVAVDANGRPVRRYLSDPPPNLRTPDPNAPVEITDDPAKKKKKFKWPWQWFASN
jgi:hypothetical protein